MSVLTVHQPATTVLAHGAHGPGTVDIVPLVAVGVAGIGYLIGLRRLGDRSLARGAGRLGHDRPAAFAAALTALVATQLPAVDAVADRRISAHMGEHMVLIAVVAPLLAWARPGLLWLLALPLPVRRRVARGRWWLRRGLRLRPGREVATAAVAVHVVALWGWHLPAANRAALAHPLVHGLDHACLLGTAWCVWWTLTQPGVERVRGPAAAGLLVATALPSAALGAILTFAGSPLYPEQAARTAAGGADPLADQQLAGLVMWGPADLVYLGAAFGILATWLRTRAATTSPDPVLAAPGEVLR